MRYFILFFLFCFNVQALDVNKQCDPPGIIKIAVIDTGFGYGELGHSAKLCKFGHKDFTDAKQYTNTYNTADSVPLDTQGHGTNIAGIIDGLAKTTGKEYCIVILKYYHGPTNNDARLIVNTIKAIDYSTNIGINIINYSSSGGTKSKAEAKAVKRFLDSGGILVTSSGNVNRSIDKNKFYPTAYDKRVISVASTDAEGVPTEYTNYGKRITRWENGTDVDAYGIVLSGTSQAAAVATGKLIKEIDFCKK